MITPVRNVLKSKGNTFVVKGSVEDAFASDLQPLRLGEDGGDYLFFLKDPGVIPTVYQVSARKKLVPISKDDTAKRFHQYLTARLNMRLYGLHHELEIMVRNTQTLIEEGDIFLAGEQLGMLEEQIKRNERYVTGHFWKRDYPVQDLKDKLANAIPKGIDYYVEEARFHARYGTSAVDDSLARAAECCKVARLEDRLQEIEKIRTELSPAAQMADRQRELQYRKKGFQIFASKRGSSPLNFDSSASGTDFFILPEPWSEY